MAALTATSPRRLPHPDGGPPLTGTNPLAIAIPSSDGRPVVADVSMGAVTHGDVLAGTARPEELVPFGGEQAHKAFALAVGLELLVGALAGAEHGRRARRRAPGARPRACVPPLAQGGASRRLVAERDESGCESTPPGCSQPLFVVLPLPLRESMPQALTVALGRFQAR